MRRQRHARQQRLRAGARWLDRRAFGIAGAFSEFVGYYFSDFRERVRRVEPERKDLTERIRVVPDRRQNAVAHVRLPMAQRAFDQPGDIVAVENDFDSGFGLYRVHAGGGGDTDLRQLRVVVSRDDVLGRFRLCLCMKQDAVAGFYLLAGVTTLIAGRTADGFWLNAYMGIVFAAGQGAIAAILYFRLERHHG